MPSPKQYLQQEYSELVEKSGAIITLATEEKRDLTDDERKDDDAFNARLDVLASDIKRADRFEERDRALGAAAFEADPDPHPRQPGMVHDLAADAPFRSFGEQLQAIYQAEIPGAAIDPRLKFEAAATGSGTAVPADGGFLIQPDFSTALLSLFHDTGILAPRCMTIPISAPSNSFEAPIIDQTSRADGSRWGGVQVYWNDEGVAATATKPKFGKISMKLAKLNALFYATDELLADASALEAVVSQAFTEEMNYILDDQIINGEGSAKPLGILKANCLVTVAKESNQAAKTIVYENIVKMWAQMWGRSWANAIWIINQDIIPQLSTMTLVVGTGGVPVYLPPGGLSASPYASLMGRPVIPIEQCATLGTLGDIMLVDMSRYLLIEKGGLQADQSMHVRFIQGEQTFRWIKRVNGQPTWASALTPAKGSNDQSPFVALAAR